MARRSVKPIPVEALSSLTTERLLAYRSRLLSLETSAEGSDIDESELARLDGGFLYFKDSSDWQILYSAINDQLSKRSHID
jgi:hypothetical protein